VQPYNSDMCSSNELKDPPTQFPHQIIWYVGSSESRPLWHGHWILSEAKKNNSSGFYVKRIPVGKHLQPLYKGLGPLSPLIASFLTMAAYPYDGKLRGVFISTIRTLSILGIVCSWCVPTFQQDIIVTLFSPLAKMIWRWFPLRRTVTSGHRIVERQRPCTLRTYKSNLYSNNLNQSNPFTYLFTKQPHLQPTNQHFYNLQCQETVRPV